MKIKITKGLEQRFVKQVDVKEYVSAGWTADKVLDDVADIKPTVKAKPTVKKAEAEVIEQQGDE